MSGRYQEGFVRGHAKGLKDCEHDLAHEWQPIDTAPRDGTLIDLWIINYHGRGERLPHCKWEDWMGTERWTQRYSEIDSFHDAFDERERATHWMPLPAPPSDNENSSS